VVSTCGLGWFLGGLRKPENETVILTLMYLLCVLAFRVFVGAAGGAFSVGVWDVV